MHLQTTFFSRLSGALARIAAMLDASVVLHRTFMDERDAAAAQAGRVDPCGP